MPTDWNGSPWEDSGKERLIASFTKKAMIDSFLRMCEKRSPDRITVRDIVEDCGINRNTFYYYFRDIYALIEEVFVCWTAELDVVCRSGGDLSVGLCSVARWAIAHQGAVERLFRSFDGGMLEDYFLRAASEPVIEWMRRLSMDFDVSDEAVRYVGTTVATGFSGELRRWIRDGMREDPELMVRRYAVIWLLSPEDRLLAYDLAFRKD